MLKVRQDSVLKPFHSFLLAAKNTTPVFILGQNAQGLLSGLSILNHKMITSFSDTCFKPISFQQILKYFFPTLYFYAQFINNEQK